MLVHLERPDRAQPGADWWPTPGSPARWRWRKTYGLPRVADLPLLQILRAAFRLRVAALRRERIGDARRLRHLLRQQPLEPRAQRPGQRVSRSPSLTRRTRTPANPSCSRCRIPLGIKGNLGGVLTPNGFQAWPTPQYLQSWNLTVEREIGNAIADRSRLRGLEGHAPGPEVQHQPAVPRARHARWAPASRAPSAASTTSTTTPSAATPSTTRPSSRLRKRISRGFFYRINYVLQQVHRLRPRRSPTPPTAASARRRTARCLRLRARALGLGPRPQPDHAVHVRAAPGPQPRSCATGRFPAPAASRPARRFTLLVVQLAARPGRSQPARPHRQRHAAESRPRTCGTTRSAFPHGAQRRLPLRHVRPQHSGRPGPAGLEHVHHQAAPASGALHRCSSGSKRSTRSTTRTSTCPIRT